MKFKIGNSKTYTLTAIDELSLKDVLDLERQTAELGKPVTANDIEVMQRRLDGYQNEAEVAADPDATMLFAISIWATRRLAGDPDLTFLDAISFKMKDLQVLPDPADHKPPANPTRGRSRQAASGPAARPRRATAAAKPSSRSATK